MSRPVRRCLRPGPLALATVAALGAAMAAAPTATAAVSPLHQASGATPFAPDCNGAPQSVAAVRDSEVEPWIDVNPGNAKQMIGVYQQDRFSTGGANGLGTSVTTDGAATWRELKVGELPTFTRCAGAAAGSVGDYERATDQWLTYSADGKTAYQMSLSFNDTRDGANAMLVSRSTDGGASWDLPKQLIRDTPRSVLNDKNSMTADPAVANNVYAVWDRLVFPNDRTRGQSFNTAAAFRGPTYFTRTTNGGESWETARPIFDPGQNDQTIGNQIAVTGGTGTLVNVMTVFRNDNGAKKRGANVEVLRSTDKGATWSRDILIDRLGSVPVTDPRTGEDVRTGDIIPSIATDARPGHNEVYAVWQDARWTNFQRDQIAFSKSSDGGLTWSPTVRINNATVDTQAFNPAIRVDAAGNISVTHYDFRNDTKASVPLETDVWSLRSNDGGTTWHEERVTPTSFDMRQAPVARGFFIGDYIGTAAAGATFTPFFSQAGPTDTYSATVTGPLGETVITPTPSPAGLTAASFPIPKGRPTPA